MRSSQNWLSHYPPPSSENFHLNQIIIEARTNEKTTISKITALEYILKTLPSSNNWWLGWLSRLRTLISQSFVDNCLSRNWPANKQTLIHGRLFGFETNAPMPPQLTTHRQLPKNDGVQNKHVQYQYNLLFNEQLLHVDTIRLLDPIIMV